jgi:catechol 2,3-dioxygenase-like lactoylglutathione lyase family enzyme
MVSIATAIKKTVVPSFGLWLALPMISHVKFISIPTHDQDRAVKFWTERAGFRVLTDQPFSDKQRWIELRVGSSDTRVVLFDFGEQGPKPGMMFNGAFACDNVEQTYQELVGKGVEFVTPPTKQHWGMFAVFKDPDDNQFLLSTK